MKVFQKGNSLLVAVALAAIASSAPASATTFNFDAPITGSAADIGPDYGGLTFKNWVVINGPKYGPSGYANVITSGQQSACGCAADYGQAFTSISSSSAFNLVGGNFASAWNNGATLLVEGFLGTSRLYSQSYVLNVTRPSALSFGFNGINLVNFSISGGTPAGLSGAGNYFAVDDLRIDTAAAVPETATWAMMLIGFGMVGAGVRSRRKATVRLTYA